MEWKPIDTAPKDGTPILVFGGHPDVSTDYRNWSDGLAEYVVVPPTQFAVAWYDTASSSWRYCSYDSGIYGEWEEPAHWMPLPAQPLRANPSDPRRDHP